MIPKDLLVDLESGDRTAEHLETREVPRKPSELDLQSQLAAMQQAANQMGLGQGFGNQMQGFGHYLGQPYQSAGANMGGIARW